MVKQKDFADYFGVEPYEVIAPSEQTRPFVFNSPHSGRIYPEGFLASSRLDSLSIRASEDYYVDQFFDKVAQFGVPFLKANFPRAWLDVNREPYELDPKMFDAELPSYINRNSIRVAGGLGTIPKIVAEKKDIYHHKLPLCESLDRIEHLYRPYHETLRKLIARTHAKFGYSFLIDCHSMPSNAGQGNSAPRPDFIIGDRYGASADKCLMQIALLLLNNMGYHAVSNKPYAGGFITEHYGRPRKNLHALQIEINRGLYIDEQTLELKPSFAGLQSDLQRFSTQFMHYVEHEFSNIQAAAE